MPEPACWILVDGRPMQAPEGRSLAAVLLDRGLDRFRDSRSGQPRAPLCAMGVCYECLVTVDGRRVRACLEPIRPGMEVRTHG